MSDSVSLRQELNDQLPWLLQECGFFVVEDRFDPKSFGNSFVTLESSDLRVRFVRDRGQVSGEVASRSAASDWLPLERICGLIAGRHVEPGFELSPVAALLRDNLSALIKSLGPELQETKRELERQAE